MTEAKTFEMVTNSLVIDDNGIAQVAMGVGHYFVAAHHGIACRLLGHVPLERL